MIAIAKFFANRIVNGKTTFQNVPELLKEQVEEALIELEYSYLAKVEGDN